MNNEYLEKQIEAEKKKIDKYSNRDDLTNKFKITEIELTKTKNSLNLFENK